MDVVDWRGACRDDDRARRLALPNKFPHDLADCIDGLMVPSSRNIEVRKARVRDLDPAVNMPRQHLL